MKGQCHCGKIQIQSHGKKGFEFICHCLDCRALNGGGHLAGLSVPRNSLQVNGETSVYRYAGGKEEIELHFCGTCSTPLFARPQAFPETCVVRANCLIDDVGYFPKKSIFPEAAFDWDLPVRP